MKIKQVTLTGADNRSNVFEMGRLSKDYPYLEWGVLIYPNRSGQARYPTEDFIAKLCELPSLSAHYCGNSVELALQGSLPVTEHSFSRIQLNFFQMNMEEVLANTVLMEAVRQYPRPVVFGGKYLSPPSRSDLPENIQFLYDSSGGKGIYSTDYLPPVPMRLTGYAGGITPFNIHETLVKLEDVVGDAEIWIDMESGIRSQNLLDLHKCHTILDEVEHWVH